MTTCLYEWYGIADGRDPETRFMDKGGAEGIRDVPGRGQVDLPGTEGDVAMKSEKLEVVRGSGSVFRDLGHKNADADQFKAIRAAEIKVRRAETLEHEMPA